MKELNRLAHELALRTSESALDSHSVAVEIDGVKWRDINTEFDGTPTGILLKKELRYLHLRGALAWHPLNPSLVRVLEVLA
jgi:hypothetical protein